MARDKLITIRIEGEKRQAFGELAKAQNTDTASLLYDFISGCLSGTLDIKLVTGKGNRLDKIDNQLDTNRLDKLETDTQRIDNQLDTIAKRLDDWIEAIDDRVNDCGRELSEKMISLEHRLKTLSIQLDIQQDRQGEPPDMGTVATVETVYTVETAIEKVEAVTDTVETAIDTVESDSSIEPDKGAIGPVPDDSDPIESVKGEGMTAKDAAKYLETKRVTVSYDSLHRWIGQEKIPDTSPQGRVARKHLILRGKLYYPIN
jgi:hypothetical protein